ncbi:hypothetical protein L484_016919 [Morus notabilis]|uniref:Uncharacterized protein n=1 Tax=Morus notabilis TaxID=981085 RepID=W9S3N6_9ROSA|nr:hypothetical protein L484_016919 [Morus notabilis]
MIPGMLNKDLNIQQVISERLWPAVALAADIEEIRARPFGYTDGLATACSRSGIRNSGSKAAA